jgi:hypothetical protein
MAVRRFAQEPVITPASALGQAKLELPCFPSLNCPEPSLPSAVMAVK